MTKQPAETQSCYNCDKPCEETKKVWSAGAYKEIVSVCYECAERFYEVAEYWSRSDRYPGYCKYCKAPIIDASAGFCNISNDECWNLWKDENNGQE
jgi:hypothetical protein